MNNIKKINEIRANLMRAKRDTEGLFDNDYYTEDAIEKFDGLLKELQYLELMTAREMVFEVLEEAIDEAFLKAQDALGIKDGYIEPWQDNDIDDEKHNLVERIMVVLDTQLELKHEEERR